MPDYLLRLVDAENNVATKPFRATDDRAAVRDGLECVAGMRAHGVLDAVQVVIDSLEIGFLNRGTGEFDTRSETRLYDSDDPDASLSPAPPGPRLALKRAAAAFEFPGDEFEEFEEQELAEIGHARP